MFTIKRLVKKMILQAVVQTSRGCFTHESAKDAISFITKLKEQYKWEIPCNIQISELPNRDSMLHPLSEFV